jgi:hypothetical protein
MRNLEISTEVVGITAALLCGVLTAGLGIETLVTAAPELLQGHVLSWLAGFPELGAGLVCTLWSRQQLRA